MNNEMIRNHYDAFSRMSAFATTYAGFFAPGSRALAQFAVISGVVTAIKIVRPARKPETPPEP